MRRLNQKLDQQLNIHLNEDLMNRVESFAEDKSLQKSAAARMILAENLPESHE